MKENAKLIEGGLLTKTKLTRILAKIRTNGLLTNAWVNITKSQSGRDQVHIRVLGGEEYSPDSLVLGLVGKNLLHHH